MTADKWIFGIVLSVIAGVIGYLIFDRDFNSDLDDGEEEGMDL